MMRSSMLFWIAGLCGIVGPIISLSFIEIAIIYSPWFNWFKNALSDLGVHEAALIFNSGLIIGGILTTIFGIGLMQIFRKQVLGFIGSFTRGLSSISLCAIGILPTVKRSQQKHKNESDQPTLGIFQWRKG